MDRESVSTLKVLMFPWLAYGHITPFLEVAKKLSDRGFSIYLCSTSVNLNAIKKKITEKYSPSIQLVEIRLPEWPELPPSYQTTNGLPPHLMVTLKKALHKAKPELSNILKTLKPDLVIYDIVQEWTAALCSRHNIPAIKFLTSSAVMLSYFYHLCLKPGVEYPYPAIYLTNFEVARVCENEKSARNEIEDQDPEDELPKRFCDSIALMRSSREIEGKYIDYISDLFSWKVVPVFPVMQVHEDQDDNELIQWLGEQTERSSVFASFGSEYFLTKEEIEEIALGLELSNVNFIWALRFPKGKKMSIQEALPKGFLERVEGRGRIVEGLAPQTRILGHPSIGGFVSHCGWNSMLESIEIGVPVIAVPMTLDQPLNARLMVELGVAIEVMRDENGRLKRENIAQVIKDVLMGKNGENLRTKARDSGERLKAREKEDLDEFVDVLQQLCEEDNLQN